MVAMPDALDQYFLDHPAELLERPCERLIVADGVRRRDDGHFGATAVAAHGQGLGQGA